jgi:thiamine biosynthesis lipoprotein
VNAALIGEETGGEIRAERMFAAMGTTVHLVGVGAHAAARLAIAEERVHHLEARWSRFRPTSELSRLNANAGTPTKVTAETFALVTAAIEGWRATDGLFDPTLLGAVERAGYDRSFDQLPSDRPAVEADAHSTPRGCAGIELDATARTVRLPPTTRLDLGGIAKGFAADLIVAELIAAGLDGACANLGGDVRVSGVAPPPDPTEVIDALDDHAWTVDIEDPTNAAAPLARLEIDEGAVVTSTRLRRRWLVDGVEQHHLVDPRTGRSAFNGWAQVSVIAGTATEAEVLAKVLFLAGPARAEALTAHGARAVLVADDGHVELIGFD